MKAYGVPLSRVLSLLLLIGFSLLVPLSAVAEESPEVLITAGPAWNGFTNKDGHGLYHDLIRLIFGARFSVNHLYVSTVQANNLVAAGRADIKLCETKEVPPLHLAAYPLYENAYFAFFLKAKNPFWEGLDSLLGKRVVWREDYYSQADFPVAVNVREVRSGESALMMVILGRADYYIDDRQLINESLQLAKLDFDAQRYGLEVVGQRSYYPVFADSERGRKLRKEFELGLEKLYRSGQLEPVYRQWGFPVPHFSFPPQRDRRLDRVNQ